MVQLVNLKESLIIFYQKRENIIRPLLKVLLAFAVLCFTQAVFPYNSAVNRPLLFLLVALVQALPMPPRCRDVFVFPLVVNMSMTVAIM